MDIPSLFMIPSAVSSGKVHSVFPNSTDADFDFNRDSDATRVNSEGLIERVGYYGSEQVVNGSFDTNSDWGLGAAWSIANGKANYVNSSTTFISQSGMTITSGKTYKVTFTISNCANTAHMTIFDRSAADLLINNENWVNGTYVRYFTASASEIGITIWGNASGGDFSIDNVSLVEVTGDRARLNYEIEGGLVNTKPSLLLEPQSTNLIPYSEDYSSWNTNQNVSVTTNTNETLSPTGQNNASKITINSTNLPRRIFEVVTTSSGNSYTYSAYVKKGTSDFVRLLFSSTIIDVSFNLTNGTVTSGTGTIEAVGNDWYRIKATGTSSLSAEVPQIQLSATASVNDYIYVFGVQVEQQSYCTSYIPTNGSVQTRANETCIGAGTSSILPSEEGILYVEAKALVDGLSAREISLSSGSSSNAIRLRYSADVSRFQAFMRSGGGTIQALSRTAKPQDVYRKIALEYNSTEFAMWIDGTKESTVTTTSTPVGLSELEFYLNSSFPFYGKIRDIRVYNTKEMTDSEVDILLTKITS